MAVPHDLDLRPYTAEGVADREAAERAEVGGGAAAGDCAADSADATGAAGDDAAGGAEESKSDELLVDELQSTRMQHDPRPEWYYKYQLRGVLAHTGTADSGHYYSFIKVFMCSATVLFVAVFFTYFRRLQVRDARNGRDEKWFEFNDRVVREFNEANLAAEAFGGTYTFKVRVCPQYACFSGHLRSLQMAVCLCACCVEVRRTASHSH